MNQRNEMRYDMKLRRYLPIFVHFFLARSYGDLVKLRAGRVSDLVRVLRVIVHRFGQSKQELSL